MKVVSGHFVFKLGIIGHSRGKSIDILFDLKTIPGVAKGIRMRSALSPTSLDSIARIGVVGGYAKAYNPSNGLE
jgi:phosphopantothenate synthetase